MVGIAGVHVEVFKDSTLVKEGYTDENGKWTDTLEAGTYLIRLSKTGYTTVEKTETIPRDMQLMVNLPKTVVPSVDKTVTMIRGYETSVLGGTYKTSSISTSYETEVL